MITNATLISHTTPSVPDARAGRTGGTTLSYAAGTQCCVDEPTRSQLVSLANKVVGMTGVIYVMDDVTPVPVVGSRIVYQLAGAAAPETVEVLHRVDRVHGTQSHIELAVKNA
ncbi:MAG TPA: hypothetical protein VF624_15070 [Tepidisphaeraceae bacterium]